MKETAYQTELMKKIFDLIPDCIVLKNDPRHIQGIPDLIVLHGNKWGALEVKISDKAPIQPNQQYYVDALGEMSFASFISPDNEEDVLSELQHALGITGQARISKP
jgi:hypothetical protein